MTILQKAAGVAVGLIVGGVFLVNSGSVAQAVTGKVLFSGAGGTGVLCTYTVDAYNTSGTKVTSSDCDSVQAAVTFIYNTTSTTYYGAPAKNSSTVMPATNMITSRWGTAWAGPYGGTVYI